MVVVSKKLGEADQTRLLHEVQSNPRSFEAVLSSNHPSLGEAHGPSDVVNCSFEVYPNQGP
jgi:hypothetical protein